MKYSKATQIVPIRWASLARNLNEGKFNIISIHQIHALTFQWSGVERPPTLWIHWAANNEIIQSKSDRQERWNGGASFELNLWNE